MRLRMWAVVTLLVISLTEFGAANQARAAPFVAIIVYAHGFAKGIKYERNGNVAPVNVTSTFTQDDPGVYAYVTAALTSANLTWIWSDPTGQVYLNRTTQEDCVISPCTFGFYVGNIPATAKFGLWRLDLLANGYKLYSDYFSITPVITQDDYWNIDLIQSYPALVHGELTVTIHPHNSTWSSYAGYLPGAANLTAFEPATNRSLAVTFFTNTSRVIVDLGGPRPDGYTFVLGFDLSGRLRNLAGADAGTFEFTWLDQPWMRPFGEHPTPTSFGITLPVGASPIDVIGVNSLTLNETITSGVRSTISFKTTVPPEESFGCSIIYRDFTYRNLHEQPSAYASTTVAGVNLVAGQRFPILPLTVGDLSLWSAVMSVFLLIGSELLSPIYAGTGIMINRRRLRFVAMILVLIFLVTATYQVVNQIPPHH